MTYLGHIENGTIVLDDSATLPDGAKVRVELLDTDDQFNDEQSSGPTLYDDLRSIIGTCNDLPVDFALNHDHYLHGQPKK